MALAPFVVGRLVVARSVHTLLRAHYGDDGEISSFTTHWPHLFSELDLYDFWFWGFLKDPVFGGSIRSLPELKANKTLQVSKINRETFRATVEHVTSCFEHVRDANKMYVEHML
ncbi:hypothetical protein AVEN_123720-1 [Araneus ventricosus]|uniref:Uncharacterized protein n=1 Tax=Araneus ventricosus TaxID=182803 RepID=A0A4Y2K3K7_ARAVE|nr:hypothetical protein AVEN_123720-1 [Araneus ventricosus]